MSSQLGLDKNNTMVYNIGIKNETEGENMAKQKVKITELTCLKCGHLWYPRTLELPAVCPKCKNPRWNREKKGV
jgi:rubrerythrin